MRADEISSGCGILWERVSGACQEMIPAGAAVLCALSGGADSVCLLSVLSRMRGFLGFSLYAAHFNHRLRGEESDRDEAFVRELCESMDIPLILGRAGEGPDGGGFVGEAGAREARYGFLRRSADALGGALIATAHTADDNVETMLINLIRGTSLTGLAGIPGQQDGIIRPMLTVTRAQRDCWLRRWALSFVEDSSNASDDYLRNRLRHHVIPLLEAENPSLAEGFAALSVSLRRDDRCLDELACRALEEIRVPEGLSCVGLNDRPEALRGRILLLWLTELGCSVGSRHLSAVLSLAASARGRGRCDLPGGLSVFREGKLLRAGARD